MQNVDRNTISLFPHNARRYACSHARRHCMNEHLRKMSHGHSWEKCGTWEGVSVMYVSVIKWDVWKLYDGAHWRKTMNCRGNAIQNVWRRSWIHKWRTFPFEKRKSLYQRVSWNNLFTARKWKCKVQEEGHSTNSWLKIGQSFQWQPKAERVDFWT